MNNVEKISDNLDLVYSPDDDGFYLQKYPGGATSFELYKSRVDALIASQNLDGITWND